MPDSDAPVLKRTRSPSPDGEDSGKQLIVAPRKVAQTVRVARRRTKDKQLLLLAAPASSEGEVTVPDPCMVSLQGSRNSDPPDVLALKEPVLVNVPIRDAEQAVGSSICGAAGGSKGEKVSSGGRQVAGEVGLGESVGTGGPIRREKPKRQGVLDRTGGQVRDNKKTGRGRSGVLSGAEQGHFVQEGAEAMQAVALGRRPRSGEARGGRGLGGRPAAGGPPADGSGLGGTPSAGRRDGSRPVPLTAADSGQKGGGEASGEAVGVALSGVASPGGKGGASAGQRGGKKGGSRGGQQLGSSARSPSKGSHLGSPSSRSRASAEGACSLRGKKVVEESGAAQAHGVLVRRIKDALLASGGEEEEGCSGKGEGGDLRSQ